jgi:hypothetical protein
MGALSVKIIPNGLHGHVGTWHKISLLMDDNPYILHGMAGTRICSFYYKTIARWGEISSTEIRATDQIEEGKWNHI